MKTNTEIIKLLKSALHEESTQENHLELFSRIYLLGYKIALNQITKSFTNQPLETEDMLSTIYMVYVDTLNWMKTTNEKLDRFMFYFSHKVKYAVINECRKYIRNGHTVLNYSKDFDDSVMSVDDYDILHEEKDMLKSLFVWELIENLEGIQKEIVLLKMDGHTVNEIAKILKCTTSQIEYEWSKIKKRLIP